jgi:hypothetical protein
MNKLVQQIETFRAKLDGWRRQGLKETQTRMTVINPLLEALGWDVSDPAEVQSGYSAVDGKEPDYGLNVNGKPVLFVEAKPLADPLNDVKAITQVVGYATNEGIAWCVLTNGIRWRVFRSLEKCPAPEKLMFEVSLDPRDSDALSVAQIAEQMWRFSREEMAKGTLDRLGEQTFTDGKVRKALDKIMRDAPRAILNLIKQQVNDEYLTPQKIKESLSRIWVANGRTSVAEERPLHRAKGSSKKPALSIQAGVVKGGKGGGYPESKHLDGKPKEVVELDQAVDRYCFSLAPNSVEKKSQRRYVNYLRDGKIFCSIVVMQHSIAVYLKLKYSRLSTPPRFTRDVSSVGHWGVGDTELALNSLSQIETAKNLICRSFEDN